MTFTVLFAILIPASLPAQEARVPLPPVAPGMRIRIESPTQGLVIKGTVTALDRTSITLQPEEGPRVRVVLDGATRLERSHGSKRRTRKGAYVGAVAGAGLSVLSPASCPVGGGGGFECNRLAVAGVGAAAGATLGAMVGFFFKSERWSVLPLDRTPTADARPSRGLRVAFRF